MNPYVLATLARDRRAALLRDAQRYDELWLAARSVAAWSLRASGDRLFRWGVALEPTVISASSWETR